MPQVATILTASTLVVSSRASTTWRHPPIAALPAHRGQSHVNQGLLYRCPPFRCLGQGPRDPPFVSICADVASSQTFFRRKRAPITTPSSGDRVLLALPWSSLGLPHETPTPACSAKTSFQASTKKGFKGASSRASGEPRGSAIVSSKLTAPPLGHPGIRTRNRSLKAPAPLRGPEQFQAEGRLSPPDYE